MILSPNDDLTNWYYFESTDEVNERHGRILLAIMEFRLFGLSAWYKPGLRDQLIWEQIDRQCGKIRLAA